MQTKNRSLRITTLIQAFHQAAQFAANPFRTDAEIAQGAAELAEVINKVLDREYEQGYEDAGEFAAKLIKEMR